MALSNIFREPRREITESLVGIAALAAFCWLDYSAASASTAEGKDFIAALVLLPVGAIAALVIAFLLLVFTHKLGEVALDKLEDLGIRLRPKLRRRVNRFDGSIEWR